MDVTLDSDGTVALMAGASGTLGGATTHTLHEADTLVVATGVVEPDDGGDFFKTEGTWFYEGDFTDEGDVACVVGGVVSDSGYLDYLANIAGTWRGGTPISETNADTFDSLFDVSLKTTLLALKYVIPYLRETEGSVVSVSVRSSLEGGEGDGIYRASKVGVRLLTEAITEKNRGDVHANTMMPSVIDTPMNREMTADVDLDS